VKRLALDTSAYSNFMKGHIEAKNLIARSDAVMIPLPVLGELYAGFETGERKQQNLSQLQDFLSQPVVKIICPDEEVAKIYGEIFGAIRRLGQPIPTNDFWIAALCIQEGVSLVSFDRHFSEIKRLGLLLLE